LKRFNIQVLLIARSQPVCYSGGAAV